MGTIGPLFGPLTESEQIKQEPTRIANAFSPSVPEIPWPPRLRKQTPSCTLIRIASTLLFPLHMVQTNGNFPIFNLKPGGQP